MPQQSEQKRLTEAQVTIEEVNRVLEVGRLLLSVLKEEELKELHRALSSSSDEV